ncbi:hypothetical protein WR25_10091 isoform C [Diploscapter pachys]|uniref:SET domain-containing protein n=1 Tax=Diploscapter pachys TaxID=2018661 RepID=A0A2A2LF90_9BILA|nr:hypothetical protein WR25_10091 isoform C [Diploscapter pachys]
MAEGVSETEALNAIGNEQPAGEMEGIEQMPLLEEEGEADRVEGNADEAAGEQQNEHVQDRPNVEMENGIVPSAGHSDDEEPNSDQIVQVAVDSEGEEEDYMETLKIRNQGGLRYPDHDYDPYEPGHRNLIAHPFLPKIGPVDEEGREIYPVDRESGEELNVAELPPDFDVEYRDRPLITPAWREQPVQRRNMQDGSTLVEGPMDRLNVQPGISSAHLVKTPIPGSSQGPQRYHGVSIPSIHQLNPLGQGRGQAVIGSAGKKYLSSQPIPGSASPASYRTILQPGGSNRKINILSPQIRRSTVGTPTTARGSGADLLTGQKVILPQNRPQRDQPMHRIMAPGSVPAQLPARGPPPSLFPASASGETGSVNYQGRAPMLVPASGGGTPRDRINGRAGAAKRDQPGGRGSRPSESQMDDPNVMVETLESGRRLHSLSPRKQVTFSESGEPVASPIGSPYKSPVRIQSQGQAGMGMPPHRLAQHQQQLQMQAQVHGQHRGTPTHMPHKTTTMSPASFSTPIASSSAMVAELPENIMDDSPKSASSQRRLNIVEDVLPPQVSEAAMALSATQQIDLHMQGQAQGSKKELDEEDIKRKIAAIQQEIQMEAEQKRQEEAMRTGNRHGHFGHHSFGGQSSSAAGGQQTQFQGIDDIRKAQPPKPRVPGGSQMPPRYFSSNGYDDLPTAQKHPTSSGFPVQQQMPAGSRPPPPYLTGQQRRQTLGMPPTMAPPKGMGSPPYSGGKPVGLTASSKSEGSAPRIHLPRDKKKEGKEKKKPGRKPNEEFTAEGQEFISEDEDASDTARCYCGLTHYCGWFMVQCDKCKKWEHGDCVDVSEDNQPDRYICTTCKPRRMRISKQMARGLQEKKLENYYEKKRAYRTARQQQGKRHSKGSDSQSRHRIGSDASELSGRASSSKSLRHQPKGEFRYIPKNEYTREVRKTIAECPETSGAADVLRQVGDTVLAKKMFVTTNVEGLVSTCDIDNNNVVMKYVGYICLPYECSGRTPGKNLPFVTLYDGLVKEMRDEEKYIVCSDSRSMGNDARYARKCCTPNCVLKHIIHNGELYIFLVATHNIKKGTELTIPFDRDYKESPEQICFCKQPDCKIEKDRLLFQANRSLSQTSPVLPLSSSRRSFSSSRPDAASPSAVSAPAAATVTASGRTSKPTIVSSESKQEQPKKSMSRRATREMMDNLGLDTVPLSRKVSKSDNKDNEKQTPAADAAEKQKKHDKVSKKESDASDKDRKKDKSASSTEEKMKDVKKDKEKERRKEKHASSKDEKTKDLKSEEKTKENHSSSKDEKVKEPKKDKEKEREKHASSKEDEMKSAKKEKEKETPAISKEEKTAEAKKDKEPKPDEPATATKSPEPLLSPTRRSARVHEAAQSQKPSPQTTPSSKKAETKPKKEEKEDNAGYENGADKPAKPARDSSIGSICTTSTPQPESSEISRREQMKLAKLAEQLSKEDEKKTKKGGSTKKSTPAKKLTGFDKYFATSSTPQSAGSQNRKRAVKEEGDGNSQGTSTPSKRPRRDTTGSSRAGAGGKEDEEMQDEPRRSNRKRTSGAADKSSQDAEPSMPKKKWQARTEFDDLSKSPRSDSGSVAGSSGTSTVPTLKKAWLQRHAQDQEQEKEKKVDAVTLSPKQEEGSGSDDAGIMSNANSKAETQGAPQNFAYPRRTARKSRASESANSPSASVAHSSRDLSRRSAAARSKTTSSVPARLRSHPSRGGLSMTFAQAKEKIQTNIRNMSRKLEEVDYEDLAEAKKILIA